jgi:hypothetical protein
MHARALIYMGQKHQFRYGGAPKDFVEAYKWYSLADLESEPRADTFIEKVSLKTSSDEIAEAKRLAAEWRPPPED